MCETVNEIRSAHVSSSAGSLPSLIIHPLAHHPETHVGGTNAAQNTHRYRCPGHRPRHRRRRAERQHGGRRGVEGDGRGHPHFDHLLGNGAERRLRPEQSARRSARDRQQHPNHAIHPHDQLRCGRAADRLVSRAFGPTQPAPTADIPNPMPGVFQQNISAQQATGNFGQALNILTTPWGFLKAAAARPTPPFAARVASRSSRSRQPASCHRRVCPTR